MAKFVNAATSVAIRKAAKVLSPLGLLLVVGLAIVAGPNQATAEVTNRLEVNNGRDVPIDFYINGTLYISQIPAKGGRDCYPSHWGLKGDLNLEARDGQGNVVARRTQRGRVNNFTWNVP
jgi:hypothetical protein